jgi:hypothetical protein
MDNSIVKKILAYLKKTKDLSTFSRKVQTYKYLNVDYDKLKPFTYTILLKNTRIVTVINGKTETAVNLKRGDYVICGPKKEKYGMPLEKVLCTYDLSPISTKKVERQGFQLTPKNTGKHFGETIEITPSWGGSQSLVVGDYIMLEFNKKCYYGVEKGAFKKTYNVV